MAGDGLLRSEMEQFAKDLNICDSVSFLGECRNVPKLLQSADVFCMPSLYEGVPVSLIEAQAAGLPCVISDTISQEVVVGKNVIFMSLQQSVQAWAQAILQQKQKPKADNITALRKSGYDVKTTAAFLQKFYEENSGG